MMEFYEPKRTIFTREELDNFQEVIIQHAYVERYQKYNRKPFIF